MKKTISFVLNKIALITLLFLSACASDKNQIMGRPPGVRTSEAETSRQDEAKTNTADRKRKKMKGENHFSNDNIIDWDADVAWSESKALDVWNTKEQTYTPVFEIEGWPYQESGSNFRVLWKGGDDSVPVFSNPTLKEDTKKTISFENGEEIGWISTHVAVLSPAIYSAKEDVLIEGFDIFSAGFTTGEDGFSKTLKKGQKLRVLLYAGDSLCYVGISGKAIETLCPTPASFRGRFKGQDLREQMQPASRMWWIELEGGKGWIALDNKYIVEIR